MYAVRFVDDDKLPDAHSWVMARTDDGSCFFFVKRRAVCPRILEQGWAGYRHILDKVRRAA